MAIFSKLNTALLFRTYLAKKQMRSTTEHNDLSLYNNTFTIQTHFEFENYHISAVVTMDRVVI